VFESAARRAAVLPIARNNNGFLKAFSLKTLKGIWFNYSQRSWAPVTAAVTSVSRRQLAGRLWVPAGAPARLGDLDLDVGSTKARRTKAHRFDASNLA